jgi:hypothetical protein
MSDERGDARTVSKYRRMADKVDSNLKEVKTLSMSGFVFGYRKVKKQTNFKTGFFSRRAQSVIGGNPTAVVKKAFSTALTILQEVAKDSSELERARPVGEAVGRILAAVRYGITAENYSIEEEDHNEIIALAIDISDRLKQIEKEADPKYLTARFSLITKENAGKLRNSQKKLLASIAAVFEKKAPKKVTKKVTKKKTSSKKR